MNTEFLIEDGEDGHIRFERHTSNMMVSQIKHYLHMAIQGRWSRRMTFDFIMHEIPAEIRRRIINFGSTTIQDLTRWTILAASRLSDAEMAIFVEKVRRGERWRRVLSLEEYYDVGLECQRILDWINNNFTSFEGVTIQDQDQGYALQNLQQNKINESIDLDSDLLETRKRLHNRHGIQIMPWPSQNIYAPRQLLSDPELRASGLEQSLQNPDERSQIITTSELAVIGGLQEWCHRDKEQSGHIYAQGTSTNHDG